MSKISVTIKKAPSDHLSTIAHIILFINCSRPAETLLPRPPNTLGHGLPLSLKLLRIAQDIRKPASHLYNNYTEFGNLNNTSSYCRNTRYILAKTVYLSYVLQAIYVHVGM